MIRRVICGGCGKKESEGDLADVCKHDEFVFAGMNWIPVDRLLLFKQTSLSSCNVEDSSIFIAAVSIGHNDLRSEKRGIKPSALARDATRSWSSPLLRL